MKKIKTFQKKMGDNSEPVLSRKKRYGVKFNDSNFRLIQKSWEGEVLLYVPCIEATSVLHMEEKIISIDTRQRHLDADTSKHRHLDAA